MIEVNTRHVDMYEDLWGLAFCRNKSLSPLKKVVPTWVPYSICPKPIFQSEIFKLDV